MKFADACAATARTKCLQTGQDRAARLRDMRYLMVPLLTLALAACENLPRDLQPKVRDATAAEVAGKVTL